MRPVGLVAVATLAVLLAASLFSPVAAVERGFIEIAKVTTNGDETTVFHFAGRAPCDVTGGASCSGVFSVGVYTFVEIVPPGWILVDISCSVSSAGSSFAVDLARHSVTIDLGPFDTVICTFTNCPSADCPVGGVVIPTNKLAILSPWFAIIGLVGGIGTAVAVVKKRRRWVRC